MKPFARLIASASLAMAFTFGVLAQDAVAQQSEDNAIRATVGVFFSALSSRNINKVEPLWVRDASVVLINPPDRTPSIGWDAVKKNWETRFDSFSEWSVTPLGASNVQINQGTATATTLVSVQGTNKAGAPQTFSVLLTQVFVKRGEHWLIVTNHASRVPQ